jgi:hypothetical protein
MTGSHVSKAEDAPLRYIIMGSSGDGDGPSRGGYIVVQPTECSINESVTVSGRWLERQPPEGSPILPMATARVELSFLPAGVPKWMMDSWTPVDSGVTDEDGFFHFICSATESGTYRAGIASDGGPWITSVEVLVRPHDLNAL